MVDLARWLPPEVASSCARQMLSIGAEATERFMQEATGKDQVDAAYSWKCISEQGLLAWGHTTIKTRHACLEDSMHVAANQIRLNEQIFA